jgi:hypothetical protein
MKSPSGATHPDPSAIAQYGVKRTRTRMLPGAGASSVSELGPSARSLAGGSTIGVAF